MASRPPLGASVGAGIAILKQLEAIFGKRGRIPGSVYDAESPGKRDIVPQRFDRLARGQDTDEMALLRDGHAQAVSAIFIEQVAVDFANGAGRYGEIVGLVPRAKNIAVAPAI